MHCTESLALLALKVFVATAADDDAGSTASNPATFRRLAEYLILPACVCMQFDVALSWFLGLLFAGVAPREHQGNTCVSKVRDGSSCMVHVQRSTGVAW